MSDSNRTDYDETLTQFVIETPLNDSNSIVRVQSFSWIWYIDKERIHDMEPAQCGKWMFFFSPFKAARMDDIVGTAVLNGVVAEAKYSNPKTLIAAGQKNGVCCLYLNGNDREVHKRVCAICLITDSSGKQRDADCTTYHLSSTRKPMRESTRGAALPER